MPLPTPDEISWADWSRDYKISTPTFQLTPVEKPDMSPFLVHMTGKREILSILKGEGAPFEVPDGYGYLQASVPEYNQGGAFDAKVVCFTESPTFALDFFRYRSIERWKADQRFGVGFDKSALVKEGVRPVIYVENDVMKDLIYLARRVRDDGVVLSSDPQLNGRLTRVVNALYPLLYPLLEDRQMQGFMWEREWRYTDPDGFVFSHQDIRVICCPVEEEKEIRDILGDVADRVTFIRTWQEYDDVTSFLRRQEVQWRLQHKRYEEAERAERLEEAVQQLRDLVQQYTLAYHSLDSFETFISGVSKEMERVLREKERISQELQVLRARLRELEDQLELTEQERREV